ncbi:hypothetical protein P40081_08305 [Paenibacillus sp. FSL P4-0081]|nr:hypothetical protein P40081_08305 [Paenibacillus sp. FSL P4-0081]
MTYKGVYDLHVQLLHTYIKCEKYRVHSERLLIEFVEDVVQRIFVLVLDEVHFECAMKIYINFQ